MKRLFNKFLKTLKQKTFSEDDLSRLTVKFNKWVSRKEDGRRVNNFFAHTNKFMVRKWCEKLNLVKY